MKEVTTPQESRILTVGFDTYCPAPEQDVEWHDIHSLAQLITESQRVRTAAMAAPLKDIAYPEFPNDLPLPYVSTYGVDQTDSDYFPSQRYYLILRVHGWDWDLGESTYFKTQLDNELYGIARLLYLTPTADSVYVVAEGYSQGGDWDSYLHDRERQEKLIKALIMQLGKAFNDWDVRAESTHWAYVFPETTALFHPSPLLHSWEDQKEQNRKMLRRLEIYEGSQGELEDYPLEHLKQACND
jgi:hypothetical protein